MTEYTWTNDEVKAAILTARETEAIKWKSLVSEMGKAIERLSDKLAGMENPKAISNPGVTPTNPYIDSQASFGKDNIPNG